jgi:hypothetical protein
MTNTIARLLTISVLLVAPVALAETDSAAPAAAAEAKPEPEAKPAAEVAAPSAATSETPPAAEAPEIAKPADSEANATAKISELESKVKGLEETVAANESAIAKSSHLKFSGYVQGRYEWHQEAVNGATFNSAGVGTPTNSDRFLIRHAYLTAKYAGVNSEYVFEVDGNNKDGLAFKDVYAAFIEPWTPLKMKLSVGQFKYPFGYELIQSDSLREMPERAAVEKYFFDGDRDRGVRLQGSYDFFNFQVALVNGTMFDGTKNLGATKDPSPYGSNDPNEFKDWVGRLGVDFGDIVGGVSGYFGKGLYIAPPVTNASDPSKNTPAIADSRYKYRLGADVQGYIDIPGLGGLALKGEVMYGKDTARAYRGVPADPCKSSATWGFILTAVQNFADDFGVVARFDGKDTLSGSFDSVCTNQKAAADKDRVLTVGGGLLYYASANLKAVVTYEHPTEQTGAKKDNDFAMAQLQAKF